MSLLLSHAAFTCTNLDQGLICLVLHDTEGLLAEHQIRIKIGSQSVHIRTYVVGPNRYDFFLPDLTIEATDEAAIIKAILSLRPIITQAAVLSAYRDINILNRIDINILNRIDEMNEDRIAAILEAGGDPALIFYTELWGGSLRIRFAIDPQNACYSMLASSAGNGMVLIYTHVVARSHNFGFGLGDVVTSEEKFVDTVLALRSQITIAAVEEAYGKIVEANKAANRAAYYGSD